MPKSPFSLLLSRCLTLTPKSLCHIRPFSTSSPDPPKPASLSARMSFVFDQIDAISRDRIKKDETLQRIRAWRESKNTSQKTPEIISTQQTNAGKDESEESGGGVVACNDSGSNLAESKEGQVVHPWPEWVELMERLVKQNYFDHRRKDEGKMVGDSGLDISGLGSDGGVDDEVEVDFSKDVKSVQTACLNFGKDRFDIFSSLSRRDIQILVGYGCPSADKKTVFSAKLLRKHVHLDEGDVCSNCSLRSSCERAYLLTNKEDEARTIDVMRVLLAYGLHPLHGTITNKPLLKQKSLKTVARKLLHEVVKLSAVPIDPNLPPPIIKKPPPKVKQPPPTPKKRVGRDDIEMKKGDWLCPKCDFMNFAKNTVCLQCDAKRPKRQLLPGEWECPQCNFLNYRRNIVCFHCECKRPPDEFVEANMEGKQRGLKTNMEKLPSRQEVSNAWNFNFDDDESDGADVAAFEYADSGAKALESPVDGRARGESSRGHDTDLNRASRNRVVHERDHSTVDHVKPGVGFDDFDDEDDIDSYEVDTQSTNSSWKASQENRSRPGISDFEESDNSDDDMDIHPTSSSRSYMRSSRRPNRKAAFSGSDFDGLDTDSDDDLSRHPKWRSSHVADTGYKNEGRGTRGPVRRLGFGLEDEVELDSEEDDDMDGRGSSQKNRRNQFSHRNNSRISNRGNVSFSDSDYDDDMLSGKNKSGGRRMEAGKRNANFRDRGRDDFGRNSEIKSNGRMTNRRSSWNDDFDDSSSQGSYNRANGRSRQWTNDRNGASKHGRSQDRPRGRRSEFAGNIGRDFGEFRNSRRVIER